MDRDDFMELVYETFADEPDNVLANGIIEAADAYVEHEKAQLSKEGTTKDTTSEPPTIQTEPQWIPVSERLPESGTYCLFTVFEHDSELEATTIETVYGCFDDYGERRYWSWEDEFGNCCIMGEEQLDGDHDEIIEKVLAWMPLPEPYKPNNK